MVYCHFVNFYSGNSRLSESSVKLETVVVLIIRPWEGGFLKSDTQWTRAGRCSFYVHCCINALYIPTKLCVSTGL